jgi:hypothetical protein
LTVEVERAFDGGMRAAAVVAGLLTISLLLGAAPPQGTPPSRTPQSRTLVSIRGSILAFAQDGSEIAWVSGSDGEACPGRVTIRNLASSRQAILGKANLWGYSCQYGALVAVAASRVGWGGYDGGGNSDHGGVAVGASRSKPAVLEDFDLQNRIYGEFLTSLAGDGPTLVYSVVETDLTTPFGLDNCSPRCRFAVVGGGVHRVWGGQPIGVPGAPPATAVAAAKGLIALVPASTTIRTTERNPVPRPARNGRVEIRDSVSGEVKTTFAPMGTVVAVALTTATAAVLVHDGKRARVEVYDAHKSDRLARASVPLRAKDLGIAGRTTVYRVGRTIYVLDWRRGAATKLAVAKAQPHGLSIEGRRVAWAENLAHEISRIRAVTLSP